MSERGSGKVVLVGNYPIDRQQSMNRFAALLCEGLQSKGYNVAIKTPRVLFGRAVKNSHRGAGKWLAYLDKYLVTPLYLSARRMRESRDTLFHICDHSNALYQSTLGRRVVATCHDVLAIRGAMGERDAHCNAGRMGRVLQARILRNLATIDYIACDSTATLDDLNRLAPPREGQFRCVIFPPVNPRFRVFSKHETPGCIGRAIQGRRYILNVGSSLPRKNRETVLRVGASLAGRGWEGITAFAGEILTPELLDLGVQLGVGDRIVDIGEVDHMALNALYSGADALIFPSYSEGFGWPVIEAQAAGCPVVCANKTSLPELAGRAAFLFDPDDVDGMTNAVRSLDDVTSRATLRSEGFENVKRFSMQNFISGYEDVYRRAWEGQANA